MDKKPPLERIHWFMAELKAGRHPTAPKLAEAFEVSLPTAYRDIEFLRDRLQAPVSYDPASKGYVLDGEGFDLPAVWIRDEEFLMLALARELFLDTEAKKILHDLFLKISRCSPSDLEKITNSITCKGTGHYPLKPGILNRIIEALLADKRIEVLYSHVFDPDRDASRRVLEPRHLLFYRGNWYLLAHAAGSLRTYALSRMEEVAVSAEANDPMPDEAEIRRRIDHSFGIFVTGEESEVRQVRLRFAPALAGFVQRTLFHPQQRVECEENGGLILTFPSTLNREVIREILSFGNEVQVLHPPELKEEIASVLRRALATLEESEK